jgi:predicted MFS family arabinose efflux permease
MTLPLFVGTAADELGLSDRQIGILASTEISGIGLASLLAVTWQQRVSWRLAAGASLGCIVAGNLLSSLAASVETLLALRFLTGFLGEGPAYALGLAILGEKRDPDRAFLQLTASQVAFSAAALWTLPRVVESFGFAGMLVALAATAALVAPLASRLPRSSRKSQAAAGPTGTGRSRAVLVALAFHMVFFVGVGSFWAYVERMGRFAGLDAREVGMALAVAIGASFLGPLLASRVGTRYGRHLPFALVAAGLAAAAALLAAPLDLVRFAAASALFCFCWNIGVAFQLGLAAELDAGGRFLVLAPAFQAAGNTLGPAVAAGLLTGNGYLPVSWLAGLCCVTSFAVFFAMAGRVRRRPGGHAPR